MLEREPDLQALAAALPGYMTDLGVEDKGPLLFVFTGEQDDASVALSEYGANRVVYWTGLAVGDAPSEVLAQTFPGASPKQSMEIQGGAAYECCDFADGLPTIFTNHDEPATIFHEIGHFRQHKVDELFFKGDSLNTGRGRSSNLRTLLVCTFARLSDHGFEPRLPQHPTRCSSSS